MVATLSKTRVLFGSTDWVDGSVALHMNVGKGGLPALPKIQHHRVASKRNDTHNLPVDSETEAVLDVTSALAETQRPEASGIS